MPIAGVSVELMLYEPRKCVIISSEYEIHLLLSTLHYTVSMFASTHATLHNLYNDCNIPVSSIHEKTKKKARTTTKTSHKKYCAKWCL